MKFVDISGQRFGRLTAVKLVGRWISPLGKGKSLVWECLCDCGNLVKVQKSNLGNKNHVKSCGCLGKELIKEIGKKSYRRLPLGHAAKNKLYWKYKESAKIRGLDFDLSKDEFSKITQQNCFYCGQEPNQIFKIGKLNGEYKHNGIDRYDNNLGYINGNMVSCCKSCNYAKHAMSGKEFFGWVERIYNNWVVKSSSIDEWEKFSKIGEKRI